MKTYSMPSSLSRLAVTAALACALPWTVTVGAESGSGSSGSAMSEGSMGKTQQMPQQGQTDQGTATSSEASGAGSSASAMTEGSMGKTQPLPEQGQTAQGAATSSEASGAGSSGSAMSTGGMDKTQEMTQHGGQMGQGTQESSASGKGSESKQQSLAERLPDEYKVSSWIGKTVKNDQGQKLGTVKDLVMDDFGQVQYVIMKRNEPTPPGQWQGWGKGSGNLVAVPIGHFQYPENKQAALTLDVSPEQVAKAPYFNARAWPNMGNDTWTGAIITYWVPRGQQGEQAATAQNQPSGQGASASRSVQPNRDMVYLPKDQEQLFEKLDSNADGAIERNEAQSNKRLSQNFDRIDSYDNGRITRSEFAAFEAKPQGSAAQGQQGKERTGKWQ